MSVSFLDHLAKLPNSGARSIAEAPGLALLVFQTMLARQTLLDTTRVVIAPWFRELLDALSSNEGLSRLIAGDEELLLRTMGCLHHSSSGSSSRNDGAAAAAAVSRIREVAKLAVFQPTGSAIAEQCTSFQRTRDDGVVVVEALLPAPCAVVSDVVVRLANDDDDDDDDHRNGQQHPLRTSTSAPAPFVTAPQSWADLTANNASKVLFHVCAIALSSRTNLDTELKERFGRQSAAIQRIMQHANLLPVTLLTSGGENFGGGVAAGSSGESQITGAGLRFCMADGPSQWWTLLCSAIVTSVPTASQQEEQWAAVATLALLLRTSHRRAFPFPEKTNPLYIAVRQLTLIGLATALVHEGRPLFTLSPLLMSALTASPGGNYNKNGGSQSKRPSRTADRKSSTTAVAGGSSYGLHTAAMAAEEQDTIIVETNFRMYAYTTNPMLISVLSQFTEPLTTCSTAPWFICRVLSHDAFVRAVRRGITAQQVLDFLELKAHPAMREAARERVALAARNAPVPTTTTAAATSVGPSSSALPQQCVPRSVADQLRLWEQDCHRVVLRRESVFLSGLSRAHVQAIFAELTRHGCVEEALYVEPSSHLVLTKNAFTSIVEPMMGGAAVSTTGREPPSSSSSSHPLQQEDGVGAGGGSSVAPTGGGSRTGGRLVTLKRPRQE